MNKYRICQVAVPSPLRKSFDYQIPANSPAPAVGCRVKVSFGNRTLVGLVVNLTEVSEVPEQKLKPVIAVLDEKPILPDYLFKLYLWVASYYHHPIGDALFSMLPAVLRQGKPLDVTKVIAWQLTTKGKGLPESALSRAPKQQQLLNVLQRQQVVNAENLKPLGISRAVVRQLLEKQLIEETIKPEVVSQPDQPLLAEQPLTLNAQQQTAVQAVQPNRFNCYLLQGETGSGKTEVYLQLIEAMIKAGKQAMVLIPEINLTPQTVSRFNSRFNCNIAVIHSGLTDKQRFLAWHQCSTGVARILIGTRSAVFTPMQNPGLIVVDEEHDNSFKQQEGFAYSARDVAVTRAQKENIPILLGSATPSLESIHNARQGRYQSLALSDRHGGASKSEWQLLDIREMQLKAGFSAELIGAIQNTLSQGDQVLVFLNRRGYSPRLSCNDCGWIAQCSQCDARYTLHRRIGRLICHHCEQSQSIPECCPSCQSRHLSLSGQGTERGEETLQILFPNFPIYRVDRDSTRRKQSMPQLLDKINLQQPCVLVGTQMLAKGHHFPSVTLVAMLDVDSGLFSPDFRASEKVGQLITQVAGRCGRGDKPGKIMIQSHYCDHPILTTLCLEGFGPFSEKLLEERSLTQMPPFRHMAIFRAEAISPNRCEGFLQQIRKVLEQIHADTPLTRFTTSFIGPLSSAMERKKGKFRYQLTVLIDNRKLLHHLLNGAIQAIEANIDSRGIQWRIDVDPVESM